MRVAILLVVAACSGFAQAPTPEQLFREAVAAQKQGDDAGAIQKYKELLKVRPDIVEARANLGAALAKLGHLDEAIEQYRAALDKNENNAPLRLNLALAYYKKGKFQEAAGELTVLRKTDPLNLRLAMLMADCDTQLHKDAEVVSTLQPLEPGNPDDPGLAWLLGAALIRSGHPREGVDRVEKAAKLGNNAQAYLLAGRTALDLTQFERARDDADAALRLNPRLPGAQTLRGLALQYLGDIETGTEALQKALAANPDDFEAHLGMGARLSADRDLPAARRHLERALQLRPDSILARYEMARLERTEEKLDTAIGDFEKVVQADPKWAQPHIELSALYFRVNRPEDGERERATFERLNAERERK
jgi:tetratricopeptide (TPR) repeat protein